MNDSIKLFSMLLEREFNASLARFKKEPTLKMMNEKYDMAYGFEAGLKKAIEIMNAIKGELAASNEK